MTDEQIHAVVRGVEAGAKVADVCRRRGASKSALQRWRAKYRGPGLAEAKRPKGLACGEPEGENRRLKRLVADLPLDNALLQDVVGRRW